jgi:hypothetical protein
MHEYFEEINSIKVPKIIIAEMHVMLLALESSAFLRMHYQVAKLNGKVTYSFPLSPNIS